MVEAGARRLGVVRAIRDAEAPTAAAESLRGRPGRDRRGGAGWLSRRKRKERDPAGRDRPGARERMESGYAQAEVRNREAREALEPLADGERPLVVTVGAAVSALIAALDPRSATWPGVEVEGDKPRLAQVLAPALLMGIMAWGMWRARYWAVLGFQLLLVFLIFSAVFGLLVQAASAAQFAVTLALLAVSGTFFFFMVKAMARIQMPERK